MGGGFGLTGVSTGARKLNVRDPVIQAGWGGGGGGRHALYYYIVRRVSNHCNGSLQQWSLFWNLLS